MGARTRNTNQFPPAPKAKIAAMSVAPSATFRRSSIGRCSGFDFSLLVSFLRNLGGGLLGCLSTVMTGVGTTDENSQEHNCDDDAATDVCHVRKLHVDNANGVFRPLCTSFDTRSAFISDPWSDVTHEAKEKTQESDGSRGLLSISTKDLSLGSGLSLDVHQSCKHSFDLFNLLLFDAGQNPCLGTVRPPLVHGFWGRYGSPDQR